MRIQFPDAFEPLFARHRYKVYYGGRGGAKSWAFARALVIQAAQMELRILCARETQRSIQESVHRLLCDQIQAMGYSDFFKTTETSIKGLNGSEFVFEGLKHNTHNIKSLEAIDIAWLEEAHTISRESWEDVIPTIRAGRTLATPEIWISFNPKFETDETYQRFVVKTPSSAVVRKVGWRDNPWFPEVLRMEMEDLKARDLQSYLHVWEGECRSAVEGAVYGKEISQAEADGRITAVPRDRTKPVDTVWDLGFGDKTAIWFVQSYGGWFNFVDYIEDAGRTTDWYLVQLQQRGYLYGTHWLPHDGVDALIHHRLTGDRTKSPEMIMRDAGMNVRIVPKMLIASGINAGRMLFPQCRFDADKCYEGLRALRMYQWGPPSPKGVAKREPLHDAACFHPDTLVLTRSGTCRIMDLPSGGKILTPCGWKPYRGPFMTRRNAQLVEVLLADGHSVKCTPEHLFLTDSGWRSAESLTKDSLILSALTRSRSISMVISSVFGLGRDTSQLNIANGFMWRRGKELLDRFQKAVIFTTRTATRPITDWQTWSVCQPQSTYQQFATLGQLAPKPGTRQRIGIDLRPDACGTVDRPSKLNLGRNGSDLRFPASGAIKVLWDWFAKAVTHQNTAPKYAKPVRVVSVKQLEERADVGCIHVEDGHWFALANGTVVHNSHGANAFRGAAVALKQPEPEREETYTAPPRMGPNSWMNG